MTKQTDPSPCCNSILVIFSRGGSNKGTKGAYVMCHACRKEFRINYDSGMLLSDSL